MSTHLYLLPPVHELLLSTEERVVLMITRLYLLLPVHELLLSTEKGGLDVYSPLSVVSCP